MDDDETFLAMAQRVTELECQLKEAEGVIEFYGEPDNYFGIIGATGDEGSLKLLSHDTPLDAEE